MAARASYPRCYFDMQVGNTAASQTLKKPRVVMELYDDTCPLTVANFLALCKGDQTSKVSGKPLAYKGSMFHRVIKGFMIQGGDFTKGDGTGGESIYGDRFNDEDFTRLHERSGLLSMANAGPNTNGSQFFITTAATPHLNGKHVVFGRVIKGMSVVRAIEDCEKGESDKPVQDIVIADCGVLAEGEDDGVAVPVDGDALPDYPEDNDLVAEDHPAEYVAFSTQIKAAGNILLKQALAMADPVSASGLFSQAVEKYKKSVRYLEAVNPSPEDAAELTHDAKIEFFFVESVITVQYVAYTKLADWPNAQRSSERILSIAETLAVYTAKHSTAPLTVTPADQSKALFRIGQAMLKQSEFEKGLATLERAQSLVSGASDGMITKLIAEAHRFIRDRDAKEKRMYQKMFE
ncbi:hypothetical protein BASA83_007259 [Batrachochytrium salamandrivorans]|nr:hypothetical protein BASA83_007259 [Batrachochytrium salamandrivorans]